LSLRNQVRRNIRGLLRVSERFASATNMELMGLTADAMLSAGNTIWCLK
jgi:hypothetical protein